MNRSGNSLLLCFSLIMILSLAAVPASAVTKNPPNAHKTWEGSQSQDPFSTPSMDIELHGEVMIVKISGTGMITLSGYEFGSTTVGYETVGYEIIDDMTIVYTKNGIPSSPSSDPFPMPYKYPHNGKITWYDSKENMNIIGTGTFGSRGGNRGSLVVNGPGLHVEGEYWVDYVELGGQQVPILKHSGWYIIK